MMNHGCEPNVAFEKERATDGRGAQTRIRVVALADIAPDELTPKAALELIYKLKGLCADEA